MAPGLGIGGRHVNPPKGSLYYRVSCQTGRKANGGTDAAIVVQLHGLKKKSAPQRLVVAGKTSHEFGEGSLDEFEDVLGVEHLVSSSDLGDVGLLEANLHDDLSF